MVGEPQGRRGAAHLFAGGFLGLDNIGVFDRSAPLPHGHRLEQADGTAWMAFYAATMLSISLELAIRGVPGAEDLASKFFEHFVWIVDAMNTLGGSGLWDDEDGFYYDQLQVDGRPLPLRVRSLVGVMPLIAVTVLESEAIDALPGFRRRMQWYLDNRPDLARLRDDDGARRRKRLLAVPSRERLVRALRYVLDEDEFLSPYGIRSLSQHHRDEPFVLRVNGDEFRVGYDPAESTTHLFGGNSNWRGPIWFPINYLLDRGARALPPLLRRHAPGRAPDRQRPHVHARRGRGASSSRRLASIFLPGPDRRAPVPRRTTRATRDDPAFRELVLFHEYFDGDTGRGLGASHQTGWTATVTTFLERRANGAAK